MSTITPLRDQASRAHERSLELLRQAADVIAEREAAYGDAATAMSAIAARWSITLGHEVTPAQVALCMIDVKLVRLAHDPTHRDSMIDVAGYAALLSEVQSKR